MEKEDWKERLSAFGRTLPDDRVADEASCSLTPVARPAQSLRVELDRRRGKLATLVSGFSGTDDELKELARELKVSCGVGGSARGGEILVQGDMRVKVAELLEGMGHKVRRINFK